MLCCCISVLRSECVQDVTDVRNVKNIIGVREATSVIVYQSG